MKLHLPLSLRAVVLSVCVFECCEVAVAEPVRSWMDEYGNVEELERERTELDVSFAQEFVLKDNEEYPWGGNLEEWVFGGGALDLVLGSPQARVSSLQVEITNNRLMLQRPGGSFARAEGGAICARFSAAGKAVFVFEGCGEVSVTGNGVGVNYADASGDGMIGDEEVPGSGAIQVYGSGAAHAGAGKAVTQYQSVLAFTGNEHVVIRGNYSFITMGTEGRSRCVLMAIGTSCADVSFAAKAGQSVECYDAVAVDGTLWVNALHPSQSGDGEGFAGTVSFSGRYTEEDIAAVFRSYESERVASQDEIRRSREVTANRVVVQGGVLELERMTVHAAVDVEHKAVVDDYLFHSGSEAEVRMADARIHTEWYREGASRLGAARVRQYAAVALPRASFSGHNEIFANYTNAAKGVWSFCLAAANKDEAVLSIRTDGQHDVDRLLRLAKRGFDTSGAIFHIAPGDELEGGRYKLLEFEGTAAEWTGLESVTLTGAATGGIASERGPVYYTVDSERLVTLWFRFGDEDEDPTQSPSQSPSPGPSPSPSPGPGPSPSPGPGPSPTPTPTPEEPDAPLRTATTLTWGGGNGVWANDKGEKFWTGTVSDLNYHNGDSVVFDCAALITVTDKVLPAEVVVSHGEGQLILISDENGEIAGETRLTKNSTGELLLSMANSYTGGTVIDGGTLKMGNAQALGSGEVRVNSAELDMSALAVRNDVFVQGTVTIRDGANFAGNLTLDHATLLGEVAVCGEATLRMSDSVLSGRLTLKSGAVVQQQGTFYLATDSTLVTTGAQTISGGSLVLAGGALELGSTLTVGSLKTLMLTSVQLDVSELREGGVLDVIRAADLSEADITLLSFAQLQSTRYEIGMSDSAIWVKLKSADLTWQPGSGGSWGVEDDDSQWNTDEEDNRFHDLDDVTFESAGEVNIVGKVEPGSIHVTGSGDTAFVGSGSITGSGKLTKDGSGTLKISTNNSGYSGEIEVTEGTLLVGHDAALGTGTVYIRNATLNGAGHRIRNSIVFSGQAGIKYADGAERIRFEDGARVSGSYTLAVGNHLTVGSGCSFICADAFTFAGGVLQLTGGPFSIVGQVSFAPNVPGSAESLSTIDLSAWEGMQFGESYTLLGLEAGEDVLRHFILDGLDAEIAKRSTLVYENGYLVLRIDRVGLGTDFASTLSSNQLAVYTALNAIDKSGSAEGELAEIIEELAATKDTAAVQAMLDRLSGEELATALTGQVEGNMAHLRRLRANMGSGQRLDNEGKRSAYVLGYDGQNHVDADGGAPGMKRTEWGGVVGVEFCVREQSLFGVALTSGSATVSPTRGESFDEDALRLDVYGVGNFGHGWQSIMSVGLGKHAYSISRRLPGGHTATAAPEGYSLNFQEEVSYTGKFNERNSLQPFIALEMSANMIRSIRESGAGSASLESRGSATSAVDLTLGARYIRSFTGGGGRTGHVSLQAGITLSQGDTAAEMELSFAGAPERRFKVEAAATDSMGLNLGAGVLYPLTRYAAITASASAILRGGAQETGASMGVKFSF